MFAFVSGLRHQSETLALSQSLSLDILYLVNIVKEENSDTYVATRTSAPSGSDDHYLIALEDATQKQWYVL